MLPLSILLRFQLIDMCKNDTVSQFRQNLLTNLPVTNDDYSDNTACLIRSYIEETKILKEFNRQGDNLKAKLLRI